MYKYARYIDANTIESPNPVDFAGIPNWQENVEFCRSKGLLPLVGTPEDRPGYEAAPKTFQLIEQTEQVQKSYQVIVPEYDEEGNESGSHTEYECRTVDVDASYIQITDWTYEPLPEPEPEAAPIVEYSKYKIKCKLVGLGLWEQVKAAIQAAGYWDSFLIIQSLRSDNAELLAALPLMAAAFPDVDIPGLLAECEVG